jgi:hypothetical protein
MSQRNSERILNIGKSAKSWKALYAGVQSINDAFHIVVKVENVFVYTQIFNLNDNVECVVYALYSSTVLKSNKSFNRDNNFDNYFLNESGIDLRLKIEYSEKNLLIRFLRNRLIVKKQILKNRIVYNVMVNCTMGRFFKNGSIVFFSFSSKYQF